MKNSTDRTLVLDIDGTLTRLSGDGIDPRVFDPILEWDGNVIFATGKAFPYPVALAHFIGAPEVVVAENGGVVFIGDNVFINGDRDAPLRVIEEYEQAGHTPEWGLDHPLNRWRETEVIVSLNQDKSLLETIAKEHALKLIDTGYAYHIKQPNVTKGKGIETLTEYLDVDLSTAIAIGDSINDVSAFEIVDQSFAVANADDAAKAAADTVLAGAHADGTVSVLEAFSKKYSAKSIENL